ncbi:hypothetical protein [Aeromicrobium sp. UC242_57]|uniref:hypothetical protein n=1 Tax=Aeromicrobium sp. UC242_57 TaxID=3374624 RepID=UPI00378C6198
MTYLRMGAAVAATVLLVGCSSGSDSAETSAATSAAATHLGPTLCGRTDERAAAWRRRQHRRDGRSGPVPRRASCGS